MYTGILAICLTMILYGMVRFVVAKWRREDNPNIHALWIPGAAILFACGISLASWII